MGACASVPKGLKAVAGAVPPPEPPKEETTNSAAPEVAEGKAEEGENEVAGSAVDDKPKNEEVVTEEKVKDDSQKHHSLNSLMNDQGESKQEAEATADAEEVPSTTVMSQEDQDKPKAAPVYDSPPKKEEPEKPSTDNIAEVTKEENKQGETTQNS